MATYFQHLTVHPVFLRLAVVAMLCGILPSHAVLAQGTEGCHTFPETGRQLCGYFLGYWHAHGGLRRFGFPISEQMDLEPATGGATQYFERAIFKPRTSSNAPDSIVLATLGADRLGHKYPPDRDDTPLPALPDTAMPGERMDFWEPWYPLSGAFLSYWQTYGAAYEFGYPISPLLLEESELDGKEYVVQYFNEVVFEYHPENAPPNDVLLSQLGTLEYKKAFPNPEDKLNGDWCGPQVQISDGTQLKFSSGESGNFNKPAVLVFGHFEVGGSHRDTYVTRPYPGIEQPVHYVGKVSGDTITFVIKFDFIPERRGGPFTATRGECRE